MPLTPEEEIARNLARLDPARRDRKKAELARLSEHMDRQAAKSASVVGAQVSVLPCDGLEDALERVRNVVYLAEETDYHVMLLWAAQSHVLNLLEEVFYLGITGPMSSGKGTAVKCGVHLAANGRTITQSSPAYLKRMLDAGFTIGIQELELYVKEDDDGGILSMLRNGYQRDGAQIGMMIQKGKAWEPVEVNVFGPKIFDFHAALDTHVRSRTHTIEMVRDNNIKRVFNARKKKKTLAPVHAWLEAEGARIKAEWTPESVQELLDSDEFQARVAGLGGKIARDHEVAMVMLLVSDLFGWDFEGELRSILARRQVFDPYGLQMEILDFLQSRDEPWLASEELRTTDLLAQINSQRKAANQRPVSAQKLAGALKDVGLTRSKAATGPNRNCWVIFPSTIQGPAHPAHLEQSVAPTGGKPLAPDLLQTTTPALAQTPQQEENGVVAPNAPDAPESVWENRVISDLVAAKSHPEKPADYDEIGRLARSQGVGDPDGVIIRLLNAGVLAEPLLGQLILAKSDTGNRSRALQAANGGGAA